MSHAHTMRTSSQQSRYRTPPALVAKLILAFGPFGLDLAADAQTTVGEYFLGPGSPIAEDALSVSWMRVTPAYRSPVGFLNPPFSLGEIKALKEAGVPADDPRIRALRIENWAEKAYDESLSGFTTIGVFPYAPQTEWFRRYVMGHQRPAHCGIEGCDCTPSEWSGHAALDYWRLSHRVSFLQPDGSATANANVNTAIIHWGPNPGFVGPWVPSGRYWSYR